MERTMVGKYLLFTFKIKCLSLIFILVKIENGELLDTGTTSATTSAVPRGPNDARNEASTC